MSGGSEAFWPSGRFGIKASSIFASSEGIPRGTKEETIGRPSGWANATGEGISKEAKKQTATEPATNFSHCLSNRILKKTHLVFGTSFAGTTKAYLTKSPLSNGGRAFDNDGRLDSRKGSVYIQTPLLSTG